MKLVQNFPITFNDKTAKTASYFATFIGLGLTTASLGPTLPYLAENTNSLLSEISYLFTARSLGYIIGSFQGGRFYDRLPGHTVMALALLGLGLALALVPLMPMLWLLVIMLLLVGIGEGTVDVGGNTLLVWVHKSGVSPFINALHFFFGVGAFLSPIIIAQAVLISGDITLAYWILALLIVPIAVWLFRLASPPIRTQTETHTAEKTNHILVGLIAFFLFLYVGIEASFGGWIFTYTVALNLSGETAAAYLASAFWGALTVGRLVAIPVTARVRPRTVLLSDLLGCLLSVLIIILWQESTVAVWLGTLGMGFSMASIFPVTISLAERRINITGKITGWFFVGASLGAMTVPWLIGQFFETVGPQVTMIIITIDILAALAVFAFLITYSKRTMENAE